ncbi:MAG: HEAT repeat domain-containing protein [Elusimicrobia bacterium]|nr:HEAT repeat domain-containing protein [Elusimicrobiota bacterium]
MLMRYERRLTPVIIGINVLLSACAGPAVGAPPRLTPEEVRASMNQRAESASVPRLVTLVDDRRLKTFNLDESGKETLKEINKLVTPAGYRLKYRFREIGVPVAQALSLSRDRQLQIRLLEIARFQSGQRARSESLLVLAAQKNPEHVKILKEALLDRDVAVQFAAVEALEAWGLPEALPLLMNASERDWSPLVRVFSAKAILQMGMPQGRDQLIKFLTDPNWLMRAMAARYLGDLGKPEDVDLILGRIAAERDNNFVLAELCLAGLKLWNRRGPGLPKPGVSPPTRSAPRTSAHVSSLFELEPLIVTAPRLRVSGAQLVPPQIDTELVGLLEKIAVEPPAEFVIDPNMAELIKLVTPQGYGLYVRYTDIGFLLTEGLAGTTNLTLIYRLETIARSGRYTPARGAAYVALGFDTTRVDLSIFEYALRDPAIQVRFGAVEGLAAQTNPMVRGILAGVAQSDASPVVRLYAAQVLGLKGDVQGVDIVRRYLNDPDWAVRALSTYFLGQLGDDADFERMLINLERETEDHVVAENCLSVLRMSQ